MSWTREQDAEWRVAVDVLGDDPTQNGHRPKLAASSWAPLELGPIVAGIQAGEIVGPVPHLMARSDGVCLLYPGEVHSLAGEPESGKGWITLATAVAVIATAAGVLYLDFEDAPASIVTRLLALGATPDAILAHFTYVRPADPFTADAFSALLAPHTYALVVIDGVSEAYSLLGLDPDKNPDAARFLAALPRPFAARGSAVLEVDHVAKSKETRGRYAIGAQHKLAGIAAGYSTDVVKVPSRTDAGLVKLKVEKDRHGHVRGHSHGGVIALVHIAPELDGERVTVTLDPPETSISDTGEFRPTVLMTRVAELITSEPGASRNVIRSTVTGRGEWIDKALALLVAEGYIERRKEGQTYAHYTLRDYENEPGPTESQPSPGNSAGNRVPGSPPLKGPGPGTHQRRKRQPSPRTHHMRTLIPQRLADLWRSRCPNAARGGPQR
jgi:hypothetical protein